MAETSYIIQNGRRLNLKDVTARKSIGSCSNLQTDTKHCLVDAINELNGKVAGGVGEKGDPGEDGVSCTHEWNGTVLTVTSASGTSSADLKGPKGDQGIQGPVGATGPQGEQGIQGEQGAQGERGSQGIQGEKGEKGDTGAQGPAGANGTSCTHSWNGTTLTVTSASGTSSANLKGDKGDKGDPGSDATVTVDSTLSSSSTNPVQNKVVNAGIESSYQKIISRGEQLVVNGNGMTGNNTNFSNFEFDGAVTNNTPGSFTKPPSVYYNPVESDEFFPVNPANTYKFSLDSKSKNGLATMYSFLSFYDVDKKKISVTNHHFVVGSTTTLAQDLKKGDKVVYLTDASGWTTTVSAATYLYVWNYTNSYGYTYPPETYTRNVYGIKNSGGYPTALDKENNTVELTSAYTGSTVPAGTSVSQGRSGGIYKYRAMSNSIPPTTWQTYAGTIGGVDLSGNNAAAKFPPGTAYAKVGFLWNTKAVDDRVWVTNISVTDVTSTNTTYKLSKSGTTISLTGSDGSKTSVTDSNTTYSAATASTSGLMSASDKSKLDGISAGANNYTHPSSHPASMITGLATVATSGSYNDLANKPTIPAAVTVDTSLSSASTNPVQNKVVTDALDGKAASSHAHGNITNAGAIGTVANKAVITTTNGVLTTGTVPVASGGTGATTAEAARTNLSVYSKTETAALTNEKANKTAGVFYIEGTGSTAGTWLGTHSEITAYYPGLMIAYKPSIAGASGLTLNINGFGAVAVVRNTTSAVTTHYGVGSVIFLVYTVDSSGTAYWKTSDYDSDTKTRSSNNAGKKMFIIGATTQSTSGQTTYSNSACYIGTDNCLYSNGAKTSVDGHTHTVSDVTGTVAIGNGGTGATTAEAARTNLSVYSKAEVDSMVGSSSGGTVSWDDVTDKPFITEGGDTLTWDGDTTGRLSVSSTFFLVSEAILRSEDVDGRTVAQYSDGTEHTISAFPVGNTVMLVDENNASRGFATLVDNANETGMTFPKAGVYFSNTSSIYITSLTINGYTGFVTEKMKAECLPEHTHGAEIEIIWENAATTSDFVAQEVPLDLSDYEFIQVFGKYESTSYHFNVMSPIVPTTVGVNSSLHGFGSGFWAGARDFTITANGVSFGDGNQMNMTTDAVYNNWNNRIVPSWIVGIRGLRQ